jgi:uncharacterized lipoprotein YbaY
MWYWKPPTRPIRFVKRTLRAIGLATVIALQVSSATPVIGTAAIEKAQLSLVELALPRAPTAGEAVWVRIVIGALPRGARLRVSTADGVAVGSLASVGVLRSQEAVSYDLPVPPSAIAGGRVRLRLDIVEAGGATRLPVAGEVEAVELRYVPVTK